MNNFTLLNTVKNRNPFSKIVAFVFFMFIFFGSTNIGYGQLLTEDFSYTTAGNITAATTNWTAHSGSTFYPQYTNTGMTFAGHAGSGIGGSMTFSSSGVADVNRTFTSQNSGTVYMSCLVNFSSATGTGTDYFLHFNSATFSTRVLAQKNGSALRFGISKAATPTLVATDFTFGTTYLLVVKYTFIAGTANDQVDLWVLPAFASTEALAGAPLQTTTAGTDATALSAVALRQGNPPTGSIDAIRVGTTWGQAVPSNGCTAPTTAASNFDFTGTTQTQMPVSFTIGSGAGRVVIMNSSNTFTAPTAGSNPSANTVYGGGQQVVYNGTGNSFTVTGLNPDTTYYYSVYEYCDTERNYGSAFAGSNATLAYTVSSCKLQAPTTLTTNQGTPVTVNAIVLASGLTDAAGQGAGVSSWIGYSAADTNPNTAGWTWIAASYLGDSTTYDEYQASIGGALASGTYYIASRFQIGSGAYTYGGVTDVWNNDSGTLTVNAVIPVVTGASLNGNVGTPFTYNIIATNTPTSYAVSSGTLPNGLTLNTTTGEISGTPTTAGSVSVDVTATNVGGTSTPATLSFTIGLSNQTITFGALSSVTYGVAPYTLTATASSTLPVSYDSSNTSVATISGTTITIVGAGTTTITASQAGDSNYNPATNVQQSLTVNQKALTITGVTADNKIQDGTTVATLSGTPTLVGVEAVDNGNVTVTGTPTATFATAAPGTAIAVTVTGYTLGGTAAGNYSVSQPTGLTADITGLSVPVATAATSVLQTTFDANWNAVSGATGYALDVLKDGQILQTGVEKLNNPGTIGASGWSETGVAQGVNSSNNYLQLLTATSVTASSTVDFSVISNAVLKFKARTFGGPSVAQATITVSISSDNGGSWTVLGTRIPGSSTLTDMTTFDLSAYNSNQVKVRLQTLGAGSSKGVGIDDIIITADQLVNGLVYIPGYQNLVVGNVTTYPVTVPSPETTYYYRVRAVNGSFQSADSNTITVTTKPVSVTWDGTAWSNTTGPDADIEAVISGAYDTSVGGVQDEFTAKKLTVTSTPAGSLTIAAGTNVTVVNEVVNQLTETAFVVESDGNLIQTNPNIVNTNAITVKRLSSPIRRLDYTLWSSPVDGQQLQAFSPGTVSTRFYTYNPSTNFYVSTLPSGDFVTGTGYLIRASNWLSDTDFNPWEGTFIGAPNNGDVTLSVANGTYNAIGNPYPSTIDADEFIGVNSITAPLYFWRKVNNLDAANNPTSSYATYTLAGGAGTAPNTAGGSSLVPDGTIQVGQGFIAQATSSSLVFSNTMRNGDVNSVFLRSGAANKSRIWLNLTNTTGVFSQALVAYMPTATTGIDAAIDGKFFETTLATQLSSIINGEEFAVQGRPAFTASDVVALGFKTQTEGNYTIAIDHVDGLFAAGQEVFLKDNLTNTVHNLTNAPYNFVATAGTANTRFEIVYESTLATQNPVLNENMVTIYKQNQNLVVNTGAIQMKDVKVYDIQGRLLVEQNNVNAATAKLAISSTNQVLIVKVTSKEGTIVTKKVVF